MVRSRDYGLLGLDVFAKPFPTERGYAEYSTELCDLLVLRMEDLNTVGSQALGSFLGMPEIKLSNANTSAEIKYAYIYIQVRNQIGISEDCLDSMYESKYARHFYSDVEIELFRNRWLKATL